MQFVPAFQINNFFTLLFELIRRDIRARYRRTTLGFLWAILRPVFFMIVFSLLRGIVDIPSDGVPYIIFSYAGLVPWTFFTTATSNAASSIISNGGILRKIKVTSEVFPAAAVVGSLFDALISGLILLGMMFWFRTPITWSILWVPVLTVLLGLLAWGIGMGVAAVGTFRRDFIFLLSMALQLIMYASPIIYPLSEVPDKWRSLYILNPIVGLIESYRDVLVHGRAPDLGLLAISAGVTIVLCAITWPLFHYMSDYFADVL